MKKICIFVRKSKRMYPILVLIQHYFVLLTSTQYATNVSKMRSIYERERLILHYTGKEYI